MDGRGTLPGRQVGKHHILTMCHQCTVYKGLGQQASTLQATQDQICPFPIHDLAATTLRNAVTLCMGLQIPRP